MKFSILFVLALLPLFAVGQLDKDPGSGWIFVEEEKDVKVFTRVSDDTNLKELRIFVEMTGNIDTLIHIVHDANNFPDWVFKCSKSNPLAAPEGYNAAYAATSDFPFPLTDRELIAVSKIWVDDEGRTIILGTADHDYMPLNDGVVRISHYESRWQIEELEKDRIFIDYQSSVDPGGNIPNWVVNLAITTGPLKTFAKLRKLLDERSNM